jgi:lipopolysaccharide export system protein LptC
VERTFLKARSGVGGDAFAVAARHTRRVRFFRRGIPVGCVAVIAISVTWAVFAPYTRSIANVAVGQVSVSGSRVTMEAPKLSGFRKDLKAFEVTAREAVQDIKMPTIIELQDLNARLETDPRQFARLQANQGVFDTAAEKLDLKGDVRVRMDDGGHRIDMRSARIDMKTGNVDSSEPVKVDSGNGTIEADTVQVRQNGKHIVFEGRVRSTFNHVDVGDAAQPKRTERSQ